MDKVLRTNLIVLRRKAEEDLNSALEREDWPAADRAHERAAQFGEAIAENNAKLTIVEAPESQQDAAGSLAQFYGPLAGEAAASGEDKKRRAFWTWIGWAVAIAVTMVWGLETMWEAGVFGR